MRTLSMTPHHIFFYVFSCIFLAKLGFRKRSWVPRRVRAPKQLQIRSKWGHKMLLLQDIEAELLFGILILVCEKCKQATHTIQCAYIRIYLPKVKNICQIIWTWSVWWRDGFLRIFTLAFLLSLTLQGHLSNPVG